jgi:hypothetical protein
MSDLFGANGSFPDVIIGKWDYSGLTPETRNLYGNAYIGYFSGVQLNKYELWFSSTISFIPYSGQPVFITDTSGNVTHTGNLLTKGTATVEKTLTVKDDTVLEKKLTVKDDVKLEKNVEIAGDLTVDKDVRVRRNLFVDGYITSANIGALETAVTSIGDLITTIDDLKARVSALEAAALEAAAAESASVDA